MPPSAFPARIHVLLARDAPTGLVIRRGPAGHVCTIGWDRRDDSFSLGQWLKGRIYPLRADLSPDGKHFIYFAMNGKKESRAKGSWTAISRVPYLKAIGLWAKGDTWHGGGLFVDKNTYWINEGYGHQELDRPPGLRRSDGYLGENTFEYEWHCVYYRRLLRDGWTRLDTQELGKDHSVVAFAKPAGSDWILRKLFRTVPHHPEGKGCHYDEHELENLRTGEKVDMPAAEWADLDRHRLVWSRGGKLLAGHLDRAGLSEPEELYDFNPMTFEPLGAPY